MYRGFKSLVVKWDQVQFADLSRHHNLGVQKKIIHIARFTNCAVRYLTESRLRVTSSQSLLYIYIQCISRSQRLGLKHCGSQSWNSKEKPQCFDFSASTEVALLRSLCCYEKDSYYIFRRMYRLFMIRLYVYHVYIYLYIYIYLCTTLLPFLSYDIWIDVCINNSRNYIQSCFDSFEPTRQSPDIISTIVVHVGQKANLIYLSV